MTYTDTSKTTYVWKDNLLRVQVKWSQKHRDLFGQLGWADQFFDRDGVEDTRIEMDDGQVIWGSDATFRPMREKDLARLEAAKTKAS